MGSIFHYVRPYDENGKCVNKLVVPEEARDKSNDERHNKITKGFACRQCIIFVSHH